MPTSDITINLSVNMQYCNGVIKYISLCNKKTQKKHRTEQDMFINQNAWKNYKLLLRNQQFYVPTADVP